MTLMDRLEDLDHEISAAFLRQADAIKTGAPEDQRDALTDEVLSYLQSVVQSTSEQMHILARLRRGER